MKVGAKRIADRMSANASRMLALSPKLQLRTEGVSQPFHCSLPERATPESLKGVLAALTEIAGKGFLHPTSKIAIVHYHIEFFVNFRGTRVEIRRSDHGKLRVGHNRFDMDHCRLVFKNLYAALEQLSIRSAASGLG